MPTKSTKADAGARKRPEFIVVFNKRSERNLDTLSMVKRAKVEAQPSMGLTLLSHAPGEAAPRMYQRAGVAAVDLDERERKALLADETVLTVVRNEYRQLPPVVPVAPLAAHDVTGLGYGELPSDPLLAYVRGLHDATRLTLEAAAAGRVAAAVAGPEPHSWCLDMVGIGPTYPLTGKGVTVAVLDTGVDLDHPDFGGAFIVGDNARSFIDGESVDDGHGHGTHCAGVIGARASSVSGRRYSVAPEVSLLVGKVLSNAGGGYDDGILEGIDWAVERGANVISMSLGKSRRLGEAHSIAYERVAENYLEDGVLIVAASGNESHRPGFIAPIGDPAAAPSVLAVAAVDRSGHVAWFSCGGVDQYQVDLSGPGVAVFSAWKGGGFNTISGTSMATPHVAGVAALYLEKNSALRGRPLWDELVRTARPLGSPVDFGAGLVQAP